MGCGQSALRSEVYQKAPHFGHPGDEYCDYASYKGPFFTTDCTSEKEIVYAKKGPASKEQLPPCTLNDLFLEAKKKRGTKVALRVERPCPPMTGKTPPGPVPLDQWKTWTYDQYYYDSKTMAKAFIKLGVDHFGAVSIFGFNSPEWMIGQNGTIMAGAKVAGIYPSDTPDQVQFKVRHSGAAVCVVEDLKCVRKIVQGIDNLPKLKSIIVWGEKPESTEIQRGDGSKVTCMTWDEAMALGAKEADTDVDARLAACKPGHCAVLIYTSGTTGAPKAVMLSHDNMVFEVTSVMTELGDTMGNTDNAERILSFLPLSHVAGMLVDIVNPIYTSARARGWVEICFARPYDLKVGSLGDRLRTVKPTLFLGVPRVWEKVAEKMQAVGAKTKGLKKKIATWAKAKGLAYNMNCLLGGSGEVPPGFARADKIVLSKIKLALGLEHCKYGMTGAAPISVDTLQYFGSLNIGINEAYGMSESCAASTMSTNKAHLWGSCGYQIHGHEVKVFNVDPTDFNKKTECKPCENFDNVPEECQGEICFRGRNVMMGYMANPDLGAEHIKELTEKNATTIDDDGWLHSGDKGCRDINGMFKITGRYKELIIGAGGENIAPVPIEDLLKSLAPALSNVMMVGDKRKFNTIMVTLKAKGATGESPGGDDLDGPALLVNPKVTTVSGAIKDPVWHKYIESAIIQTNKSAVNNASMVQRFTILPQDFSVETEEFTPTLKLKRSFTEKKYHDYVESMYVDGAKGQTFFPLKQ